MKKYSILFVAVLVIVFVSCKGRHSYILEPQNVNVRVLKIVDGKASTSSREYVGTIEESFASNVSFESSGRITAIYVREGQRVKRGQLLATIDTATAAATYTAAKATLDRAEDGYRRAKQVYDKGSLPEVKWVEVQSQLDQARSTADIARRSLKNCQLYSPVDGIVGIRMAEVGTVVSPASAVFRILNVDRLYVRLDIPEVDINKITVGDRAQARVLAVSDTVMFNGVVEERSIEADMLSHSYKVRVGINNISGFDLLPGMVCRVRFSDEKMAIGCEVPRRSVQLDSDGGRFVWVIDDSMSAMKRYVHISDMTERGVLVDSGLSMGNLVVTDGAVKLSSGSRVAIIE